MTLDKIVVFILAIAFFGGIVFVYWNARKEEKKEGQASFPASLDAVEINEPKQSKEKARKNLRS